MKKLLIACKLFLILLFSIVVPLINADADAKYNQSFTSATRGTAINLTSSGIAYHRISWAITGGTVSSCAIQLDSSTDGSSWTGGGIVASQNCAVPGVSTLTNISALWASVNLTTFTVSSGSPSLVVTYTGFINTSSSGTTSSVSPAATTVVLDRAITFGSLSLKAYFISPASASSGILLSLHNNGAGSNAVNFTVFYTIDSTATQTAAGLTADKKWAYIPNYTVLGTGPFDPGQMKASGSNTLSVASGDTITVRFSVLGAVMYGVKFDSGSGVQTADILYSIDYDVPGSFNYSNTTWFWNPYQGRYEIAQGTKGMGQVVSNGIEYASLGGHSYTVRSSTVNPAANAQLLNINCNGGCNADINLYYLTLASTVAVQVDVIVTSTLGSTCTAITPQNTAVGISNTSSLVASKACTTPPTTVVISESVMVPANSTLVYPLNGFIMFTGSFGLSIQTPITATGTVLASLRWAETQP